MSDRTGHEARASRPELPAREHEEIADLIERLLGCLEGPAIPLHAPLAHMHYAFSTLPIYGAPQLSVMIELRTSDDGRAIRWMIKDPYGSPMKQGVWLLSDSSVTEYNEKTKR